MISNYESEPEMSEEYALKYHENELGNSTETLQTSLKELCHGDFTDFWSKLFQN